MTPDVLRFSPGSARAQQHQDCKQDQPDYDSSCIHATISALPASVRFSLGLNRPQDGKPHITGWVAGHPMGPSATILLPTSAGALARHDSIIYEQQLASNTIHAAGTWLLADSQSGKSAFGPDCIQTSVPTSPTLALCRTVGSDSLCRPDGWRTLTTADGARQD